MKKPFVYDTSADAPCLRWVYSYARCKLCTFRLCYVT